MTDEKGVLRSHRCGDLTREAEGQIVTLCGWVHSWRDHGGVIFIDLRDKYGLTQIVFEPSQLHQDLRAQAEKLRREYVIQVLGKVRLRGKGLENPNLKTGEIEVVAEEMILHNKSDVPPIEVTERNLATEELRYKFRYIDLRRAAMQQNLAVRHKAAQAARHFLNMHGFMEIETPLLVRSTPEGARDYIVPSRLFNGSAYSLPQSPQLYKQILMISGCDRYYQIARCLRDEDLRQDRQPEFTQIDIEASYIKQEFIFELVEGLMREIFQAGIGVALTTPFTRITHAEALTLYGSDKPDLRFGFPITDVTEIVKKSSFTVFQSIIEKGGTIQCINPPFNLSRKVLDELIGYATKLGAGGMAWMRVTQQGLESNIVKFFDISIQERLKQRMSANPETVLLFIAEEKGKSLEIMGKIRLEIARRQNLLDEKKFQFCWVTDFPLFRWDEKEKQFVAEHHIFTMPREDCLPYLESDPAKVVAQCYDLVLNGIEVASGSIRIHQREIQEKVMKVIGMTHQQAEESFGFLLEAFKYGAPPHGGIAPGLDRLVALMCGTNDIREVIAFPKSSNGSCLMDACPSPIRLPQLKELGLKIIS